MDNKHLLRILVLENQVRQYRTALELLGLVFCDHCGKPHRSSSSGDASTFINLTIENETGHTSLHICMDDPTSARCFLATINKKMEDIDGKLKPVKFHNLEGAFAKWILESGSYQRNAPYHGFVQSVMAGESRLEPEELAFQLAYWRNAPYSKLIAGETIRDLISMCGWCMNDEEHEKLIQRCREIAKTRGHTSQVKYFTNDIQLHSSIFSN